MELLVCVVNEEGKLEDILSGLLQLGVTGATVVNSHGMARHLTQALVFAGLQDVLARARLENSTIFSVIETEEMVQDAINMIRDVCGDLSAPGTGILFTIPLNRVIGLSRPGGSSPG
jgi:nitrogen regulatory protein P-II 1